MKIVYIECNAEEMKANRTLIDALADIANGIVDSFSSPISDEFEEELSNAESEGKG